MSRAGLDEAVRRMRDRGIGDGAVAVFSDHYRQLEEGSTGTIPEDTIEPLAGVPQLDQLEVTSAQAAQALGLTAVVKLNGGLGTSMGLAGPKTAIVARDGLSFLDIIARQTLAMRAAAGVEVPLLFMDSFRTQEATVQALQAYPQLAVPGLPLDFLQNAEPKLRADTLEPVDWPADPGLEWCPPGHGDVFVALAGSGLLDALTDRGVRFLFLSNADNLGATADGRIPAWMQAQEIPYVAEVAERTVNDRKGGHLARRRSDGRLILRDSAMVAPGEEHYFADETRHGVFHVNNLWVDLAVLRRLLDERGGVLGLPIIVNRKTVDPTRKDTPPVIQLESAMGTAIEVFDGAAALMVPRTRFRPVKTTNELCLLRSDCFALDRSAQVVATTDRPDPLVDLDGHYTMIADFDARFPRGVPSLRDATAFRVRGDVTFGAQVSIVGDVTVETTTAIAVPDGTRFGPGPVDQTLERSDSPT